MKEPLLNLEPKTFAATLLSICSSRRSRSKRRRRRVLHTFCPSHSMRRGWDEASPWSSLFTIRVCTHANSLYSLGGCCFAGIWTWFSTAAADAPPQQTSSTTSAARIECAASVQQRSQIIREAGTKRRAEAEILKRRLPNNGAAAWPTLWVQVSQGETHHQYHHSQLGRWQTLRIWRDINEAQIQFYRTFEKMAVDRIYTYWL
jgi:hypothetical protein